jgi:hypothetical protein
MAQQIIDITGNTYNFLEVLGFSHIGNRRRSYWKCKCLRCGKIVTLRKDEFAYPYSHQKSCGCWHPEESRIRINNHRDEVTGRITK